MNQLLLEIKGIHKHFPGVHALKGVNFDVRRGEVHALVGENGAGKSTLMHILAGVYPPDSGSILLEGQPVSIPDEHAGQRLGIGMVYQERSLFPLLNVAENICAGNQPVTRWGVIDRRRMRARATAVLAQLNLEVDPQTPLDRLAPAQQQMVEVAKALALDARLLIFDEPTAALSEAETGTLFRTIAQLKQQQAGIIYISHRLQEIFGIADRVTVLRDGEHRGTFAVAETSPHDLVARMVGREVRGDSPKGKHLDANPLVLEVRHLSTRRSLTVAQRALKNISFSIRAGEMLGIAGLAGAGRTELALAIFGATHCEAGEVLINGRPIKLRSPREAIAAGVGYVPEDRKEAGLFLEMSIAHNIAAAGLDRFGSWWMNDRRRDAVADAYRTKLQITAPHVGQPVKHLSGGNQQKVMLARWLLLEPRVLVVDEPTRGIDVGAKAEVHALLRELAEQGAAVVVISSDLPEVLAVSDRILVMREGRISGTLARAEATEEKIMRYASLGEEAVCR